MSAYCCVTWEVSPVANFLFSRPMSFNSDWIRSAYLILEICCADWSIMFWTDLLMSDDAPLVPSRWRLRCMMELEGNVFSIKLFISVLSCSVDARIDDLAFSSIISSRRTPSRFSSSAVNRLSLNEKRSPDWAVLPMSAMYVMRALSSPHLDLCHFNARSASVRLSNCSRTNSLLPLISAKAMTTWLPNLDRGKYGPRLINSPIRFFKAFLADSRWTGFSICLSIRASNSLCSISYCSRNITRVSS